VFLDFAIVNPLLLQNCLAISMHHFLFSFYFHFLFVLFILCFAVTFCLNWPFAKQNAKRKKEKKRVFVIFNVTVQKH
jgi:hypothetical protein